MDNDRLLIALRHDRLDIGEGFGFLEDVGAGGHALFVGTTRKWTGEKETVRLGYECFERMALREMRAIAERALGRWPVRRVVIVHRLGEVPAGEASILVGACAPHRAEAFEACRFLIDTVKRRVPIWKKEVYADGSTEWVRGALPEVDSGA